MPFKRTRSSLTLAPEEKEKLEQISKSRTNKASRVKRAQMLLLYHAEQSVTSIARTLSTSRPTVDRCVNKALSMGCMTALDDLPRSGKSCSITPEARAWLISLACQKPKDLGYASELWTNKILAEHIHTHCLEAGYPSLIRVGRGTISKILARSSVKPHKITYYLEKRDPDFKEKMVCVLHVYKEVEMHMNPGDKPSAAFISYDEKPGIQAIANVAPDLPPVPGTHPTFARDHEYKRHGTVSFLAGIDLLSGQISGLVADRHRSREFIQFLKLLDETYPKGIKIRMILDNHSAHISKETRKFLSQMPNRFDLIFTPKHGSWLNIIESFFAKMTKTFLREIRVESKSELKHRIMQWIEEMNRTPVIFRWKYGLDSLSFN